MSNDIKMFGGPKNHNDPFKTSNGDQNYEVPYRISSQVNAACDRFWAKRGVVRKTWFSFGSLYHKGAK